MKYLKILSLLIFSAVIFISCNDAKTSTNTPKKEDPQPIDFSKTPNSTNSQTSNQTATEPAQNAQGVYHYTCSQGCAGGAASAVNCATCGNLLVHNQGYHANTNTNQNDSPFMTPPTTETGQNAAGVWHYTCGQGCAGGSGSAGNCSNCGSTLAHNQAYHQ
ncbi:MAG: hypothetical protein KJO41_07045 [Bacteroidia bacterium]|nr:hypothetical protein [Bacteroidia bacterium]MBT8278740.1 hypothetical protein [Bacteroidia bacterium]MBT8395125.1 hypothetical protein [Bacteroidia bacterium]NND26701.1 hypothetical protein [Flavobacteriaceae bacterium]NNL31716.1 hypothetical protein [Flavobacteriaceae bacterium]